MANVQMNPEALWVLLEPLIDSAIDRLSHNDRSTLLVRYFEYRELTRSLKGSSLTFYLETLDELMDRVVGPASESDVLTYVESRTHLQLLGEPRVRNSQGALGVSGDCHLPVS
jgi:hypothetical protein